MLGVSHTADPKVRTAEDVVMNLVYPRKDEKKEEGDRFPLIRAQSPRRMASLGGPRNK